MIVAPFVRSPYNYDVDEASSESGLLCLDPTLAVQDQRDEVDINTIVRRFGLTGQLPDNVRAPVYGDFDGVSDYQSAMNAVLAADAAFMTMPAEVRARFGNSAQEFVAFCSDEKNAEEMKKLGLVKAEVVKEATLGDVVEAVKGLSGGSEGLEGPGSKRSAPKGS